MTLTQDVRTPRCRGSQLQLGAMIWYRSTDFEAVEVPLHRQVVEHESDSSLWVNTKVHQRAGRATSH